DMKELAHRVQDVGRKLQITHVPFSSPEVIENLNPCQCKCARKPLAPRFFPAPWATRKKEPDKKALFIRTQRRGPADFLAPVRKISVIYGNDRKQPEIGLVHEGSVSAGERPAN
ncbi:hypothetical protein BaRGS_00030021, partial [Batillaria attramentaria]